MTCLALFLGFVQYATTMGSTFPIKEFGPASGGPKRQKSSKPLRVNKRENEVWLTLLPTGEKEGVEGFVTPFGLVAVTCADTEGTTTERDKRETMAG